MKKIILLIVVINISLNLFSQSLESVDWGTYRELPEGTSYHQAVGFDSDAYYFLRTDHLARLNKSKVWLDSYSTLTNSFDQSNEILLPSVSGIQTTYKALFYKNNKFILFSIATDKNRNQYILYVSYLKPDGSLKNKAKEIAAVPLSNAPKDKFDIFL